jgi:hypothetical protein
MSAPTDRTPIIPKSRPPTYVALTSESPVSVVAADPNVTSIPHPA